MLSLTLQTISFLRHFSWRKCAIYVFAWQFVEVEHPVLRLRTTYSKYEYCSYGSQVIQPPYISLTAHRNHYSYYNQ